MRDADYHFCAVFFKKEEHGRMKICSEKQFYIKLVS